MADTEDLLRRLAALPPELRLRIWPLTVIRDKPNDTRIPAVVKAMRPVGEVYHQYLDQFYRSNTFKFDGTRIHTVRNVNEDHLSKIKRLSVEFRYGGFRDSIQSQYVEFFRKFAATTDLEVLEIEIRVTSLSRPPTWLREFIRTVCPKFLKLKSFSVLLQYADNMLEYNVQAINQTWLQEVVKTFTSMGIESRLETKSFPSAWTLWIWESGMALD